MSFRPSLAGNLSSAYNYSPAEHIRETDNGAFYDMTDQTTWFQDWAGTNVVTAPGQGVSVMGASNYLNGDVDAQIAAGTETLTNNLFTSDVSGWADLGGANPTWNAGSLEIGASSGFKKVEQQITTVVGKQYCIWLDTTANNPYMAAGSTSGAVDLAALQAAGGTTRKYFTAVSTTTFIQIGVYYGHPQPASINEVFCVELDCHVAWQYAGAKRPTARQDGSGNWYLEFASGDELDTGITGAAVTHFDCLPSIGAYAHEALTSHTSTTRKLTKTSGGALVIDRALGTLETAKLHSYLAAVSQAYDAAEVTSLEEFFREDAEFDYPINDWDVSGVTNFERTFQSANAFNQSLADWDTSNGTTMYAMFYHNTAFNGALTNWDTGAVTGSNFGYMFSGATAFNQPVGHLVNSSHTSLTDMFNSASAFDQDLSDWDVSNVTNFNELFDNCAEFTGIGVENWTINTTPAAAINMTQMFVTCPKFVGDVSGWDVSEVDDMYSLFAGCHLFNADISGWDTGNVTNMASLFTTAYAFNQDISGWDTSSVTSMTGMFRGVTSFNQDISGWDVSNVTSFHFFTRDVVAYGWNFDLSQWDISGLTSTSGLYNFGTGINFTPEQISGALIAWAANLPAIDTITCHWAPATTYYASAADAFNTLDVDESWTFNNITQETFDMAHLYALNEDGFYYDFQDTDVLRELYNVEGTPIGDGDGVDSVLDQSKALALDTVQTVTGWTNYYYDTFSSSGDEFTAEKTVAGGTAYSVSNTFTIDAYDIYKVELDVENVSEPSLWHVDFGQTTNSRSHFEHNWNTTTGTATLTGYISSWRTAAQSLRVVTGQLGEIVVTGARIYKVLGNHGYQPTSADRPIYDTDGVDGILLDLATEGFDITIPAGGLVGTMIIGTDVGISELEVDLPAGTYELGGNYFPATSSDTIVGVAMKAGGMSAAERTGVVADFVAKGAVHAITGSAESFYREHDEITGINNLNITSATTSLKNAFRDTDNIGPNLDMSSWDGSAVTDTSAMCYQCYGLETIDFGGVDFSAVTTVSSMFNAEISYGVALTTVSGVVDFSACTNFSYMFRDNYNLTSVDLSTWTTGAATIDDISRMFYRTDLTTLDISGLDLSVLSDATSFLVSNTNLTSITIGSALDDTPCLVWNSAFKNCALDVTTVNAILVALDTAGYSNGTLDIDGGTNAAPTAAGEAAIDSLNAKGWTLAYNGGYVADEWWVNGKGPDTVASFIYQEDKSTTGTYFRSGGSNSTFGDMFTVTRASTAWYVDSNGDVVSASSNVARYPAYYYVGSTLTLGGCLYEEARTNDLTYSDDMTNDAAWTKTNITATKDQTGADGNANTATRLTATSANGTCFNALTKTSADRVGAAWVKRITGTGTIEITQDGGTTYTDVTAELETGNYVCVQTGGQTLANPSTGFRIVTDTDEIAVQYATNEVYGQNKPYVTSPIPTTTVAVTRAIDSIHLNGADTPDIYASGEYSVWMEATIAQLGGQAGWLYAWYKDGNNRPGLSQLSETATATYCIFSGGSPGVVHGTGQGTGKYAVVNTASRMVSSTEIEGANDGTSGAVNSTSIPAFVDMTSTSVRLMSYTTVTHCGYLKNFVMWDADIAEAGIESVTG